PQPWPRRGYFRIAACAYRDLLYETDRLYGLLIARPPVPRRPERRLVDDPGDFAGVRDFEEPFDESGATTCRARLGRDRARAQRRAAFGGIFSQTDVGQGGSRDGKRLRAGRLSARSARRGGQGFPRRTRPIHHRRTRATAQRTGLSAGPGRRRDPDRGGWIG